MQVTVHSCNELAQLLLRNIDYEKAVDVGVPHLSLDALAAELSSRLPFKALEELARAIIWRAKNLTLTQFKTRSLWEIQRGWQPNDVLWLAAYAEARTANHVTLEMKNFVAPLRALPSEVVACLCEAIYQYLYSASQNRCTFHVKETRRLQ